MGDAVEVVNVVTEAPALIALAGPANKQGRIAANAICGRESSFTGSQGSSVLKLFELDAAATGLTLASAQRAGLDSDAVILSPANHATYYPGAETMTLKVDFERETGRILGGQAIGRGGVDKRIDVLAVAVRARMSASDLAELDLAYAPPYSSAKDPVNMAGFIIENILEGLVDQVSWDDALALSAADENVVLLDTRTAGEHARGRMEDALHIPVDELRERLKELPRDKRLLVFCASGLRSYVSRRILAQHGFYLCEHRGRLQLPRASRTRKLRVPHLRWRLRPTRGRVNAMRYAHPTSAGSVCTMISPARTWCACRAERSRC